MWKAAPDEVKVIDVRTPEEYAFVGHAEMAWNIPSPSSPISEGRQDRGWREDELGFCRRGQEARQADRHPAGHVPVGDRSAKAVNLLAAAGFTNAYNVMDGVEGDKVEDPE